MCRRMRHLKPREIQGCQLALDASIATSLYDATAGGSLVAADGVVKRWEDQSGNGYNVTEATNGPQRKVATMNGLDTIYFDGANDKLSQSAASQSKFLHVSAGATFAAVAQFYLTSNPADDCVLFDNDNVSSSRVGTFVYFDDIGAANNQLYVQVNRGFVGAANTTSYTAVNNKVTPNAPAVLGILLDNGNATANLRQRIAVNGAPEYGGNTVTNAASSADPTYAACIGAAANSGSGVFMTGYISEINGWNVLLSEAVRKRLHQSRQRKWRING